MNEVVFELPDAIEAMGYSKATKVRVDSTKLQSLGWKQNMTLKLRWKEHSEY